MSFFELANRRHSTRRFLDKEIENEKLVKIVEMANLTPSACNSQPWKVLIVKNKDLLQKVAKCGMQLGFNDWLSTAKAVALIIEEKPKLKRGLTSVIDTRYFLKQDLGAYTYGLTLAATDLGVGSCIIGIFDRENLAKILDLDDSINIFGYVALGYSEDDAIPTKIRKNVDITLEIR